MQGARQFQVTVEGKTLTIETGKLAGQAGGAVTFRLGDTVVLAVATMSETPREGIDFFPLTVDYEERLYAGGRIPGSFFRREGRPSEAAILTARLTDRPLRPLFPKDMRNDVQVLLYALSSDGENPVDILCINGASAALTISDIPFGGPVGAVRVGRIDGAFVFNPTYAETDASELDLRIAGTRDAILMVECGANEVSEAVMVEALAAGHRAIRSLIDLQLEMQAAVGKPKASYKPFVQDADSNRAIRGWVGDRMGAGLQDARTKEEHAEFQRALGDQAVEALAGEGAFDERQVRTVLDDLYKDEVRRRILKEGVYGGHLPCRLRVARGGYLEAPGGEGNNGVGPGSIQAEAGPYDESAAGTGGMAGGDEMLGMGGSAQLSSLLVALDSGPRTPCPQAPPGHGGGCPEASPS